MLVLLIFLSVFGRKIGKNDAVRVHIMQKYCK